MEFPVYESSLESVNFQKYEQTTSIEEIEHQMDDWLQQHKVPKKKVRRADAWALRRLWHARVTPLPVCSQPADWTEDEVSLLSRLMVKFPGGTPGRWEKIAQDLGRSVADVKSFILLLSSILPSEAGTKQYLTPPTRAG